MDRCDQGRVAIPVVEMPGDFKSLKSMPQVAWCFELRFSEFPLRQRIQRREARAAEFADCTVGFFSVETGETAETDCVTVPPL